MEISNLLVAIMFSTIIVMGMGNILVDFAALVNHEKKFDADRIGVGWKLLLLIIHFNMFWSTRAVVEADAWEYFGFLFVVAGPILMFLATSLLLSVRENEDAVPSQWACHSARFFFVLAILQVWVVGADFVLGRGLTPQGGTNLGFGVLCVLLALTTQKTAHRIGLVIAWLAILASVAIQSSLI